jgi:hypothetical protein
MKALIPLLLILSSGCATRRSVEMADKARLRADRNETIQLILAMKKLEAWERTQSLDNRKAFTLGGYDLISKGPESTFEVYTAASPMPAVGIDRHESMKGMGETIVNRAFDNLGTIALGALGWQALRKKDVVVQDKAATTRSAFSSTGTQIPQAAAVP